MTTPPFNPGVDGGYMIYPDQFRVPDLLSQADFISYMKYTYGVDVTFSWPTQPPPTPPAPPPTLPPAN